MQLETHLISGLEFSQISRQIMMSSTDAQHDVPGHLAAFDDLMRGGYLFKVKPSRDVVLQHPALKHSSECRDCPGAVTEGQVIDDEELELDIAM